MEKLVKPHWSNLFSVGFSHLKPLCGAAPALLELAHAPLYYPAVGIALVCCHVYAALCAGASICSLYVHNGSSDPKVVGSGIL